MTDFKEVSWDKLLGKNSEDILESEIEIKGKLIKVHNQRVEEDITSDVILAYFPEESDRKYILELATIHDDNQNLINRYYSFVRWYKQMIGHPVDKDSVFKEKVVVNKARNRNMFMKRIDWLCNLNRNKPNNPLQKDLLSSKIIDDPYSDSNNLSVEFKDLKKQLANQEKQRGDEHGSI